MNILVAGPHREVVEYKSWLSSELGAHVGTCFDPQSLGVLVGRRIWDLAILDCQDGVFRFRDLQRTIREIHPELPVMVIAAKGSLDSIEALRLGMSDYLVAPVDSARLVTSVRALLRNQLDVGRTNGAGTEESGATRTETALPEAVLFGNSAKMLLLKQVLDKVLNADLPVLITGESGTGKEMVARYLWSHSLRRGPFVKVNCAAIPSELLESELFGFEKGAFTGAHRRKPGKFEVAHGGFLFLDEITELSYPLQSKLLHVLQDGSLATLGSTSDVAVDVRIIAATNQDLEQCVRKGVFREDLFFRLNVVRLHVPALRERLDQMDALIEYFSRNFAAQYNTRPLGLDQEMKSFLYSYSWPGNIRELENVIRRATVLGADTLYNPSQGQHGHGFEGSHGTSAPSASGPDNGASNGDSPGALPRPADAKPAADAASVDADDGMSLREIARRAALAAEREAIAKVLQQTRWNRKKTARILDVSYKTLLTKIKETGLDEA